MNRTTRHILIAFPAVLLLAPLAANQAAGTPLNDALAVCYLADEKDSAGEHLLKVVGAVKPGVALEGKEAEQSRRRGGAGGVGVTSLTVENRKDPLGIDVSRPALGWQLSSAGRGVLQTAYQVRVATSESRLAGDADDVWDSGKVSTSDSVHVRYGGPALRSACRYYWQVRVWDNFGNVSAWSPTAWWEMGLLNVLDWAGAKWIGGPQPAAEDEQSKAVMPAPQLRKDFSLSGKPAKSARLYISSGGYYEAWLNGQRVGDHVLDPGFTVYDKRIQYVTHDVTSLIKPEENTLGAVLGRGFYGITTPTAWDWDKSRWHGEPRVLAKLVIEHVDGSQTTVISDETWQTHASPTLSDCPYLGETYDARLETAGWTTPGYDATGWAQATVLSAPTSNVVTQTQPPIRTHEVATAETITSPKPGVYVYKFPFVTAGWARLNVKGPAGTQVKLRYAEDLKPDGNITIQNAHVYTPGVQTDAYILSGRDTETWEPRFSFKGFQYIEATGYPGKPDADSLKAIVIHSDVPHTGDFKCSNELLNFTVSCD